MFSGKSMKLTPGFSLCACLNALRTTSGIVSGSITWTAYFEIGRNRFTRSRCWWLSLWIRVVADWPEMATSGGVVHVGVGHAGHQIGGPGPERGQAHAGPAGQPPVDVGHEGGRLLVAGGDEADLAVQQDVQDVDVLLAGEAENDLHALVFQTADE